MDSQKEIVIVTGSSGLVGSAVVGRLAGTHQVIGFDREGYPHPPPQAECICVDVTSDESVQAGLERVGHGYGSRIASIERSGGRSFCSRHHPGAEIPGLGFAALAARHAS